MPPLIPIEVPPGGSSGQLLRGALSLSAATGQGFEMLRIRERRPRPGLLPHHVAAVRATSLACSASVHGGYDGSPELRFEPGPVRGGEFRFEVATGGAATLLAQAVAVALATAGEGSRVAVTGATHVSASPAHHYLERHWAELVARLGLHARFALSRASFRAAGAGELRVDVRPWQRPASLRLDRRGALVSARGTSGVARLGADVAERLRDAARSRLWEAMRIDADWEIARFASASPGSFVMVEAIFEHSRAAWCLLGERGQRPERLGDRAARRLLAFLDQEEGAVDAEAADQLAIPLALAGGGGTISTPEVTSHLEGVAEVVRRFGVPARCWGRTGGPGGLEVERC